MDDKPVWSIVCLFIAREHREKGVSVALIQGAVEWARSNGARIIEAYPVEPRKKPMPPVFAYTGIASAFLKAGFREVARRLIRLLERGVVPERIAVVARGLASWETIVRREFRELGVPFSGLGARAPQRASASCPHSVV